MKKIRHHRRVLTFLQAFRRDRTGVRLSQSSLRPESLLDRTGSKTRENVKSDVRGRDYLQHLSSLLDSVSTGIISLDGEGRIRVFNAAAEVLFGLPRSRVAGMPFREAPQVLPFANRALQTFWERLSDAVWAAGAALDLEYDLTAKPGQRKIISYSVYPLGRMAWSVGNGVVIMLEDVTRKKEMEEQIGDARKRLLEVFEGITDGIQVVDSRFRVTAVNRSMTGLLNRTIAIGARCYEAFGAMECPSCPAEETFRSGQPASVTRRIAVETTDQLPNGEERCIEISTFPLLDRGNRVIQVVEYIKDVTEKVRLNERLEHTRRLAELGEMAARIAHEVRNPLNAIAGAVHYLSAEYTGDETIRKFTDLIRRQTMRLNHVASDILNAARPMRLNRTSVNINSVLWQALAPLREHIQAQGIVIENSCGSDIPLIRADELQIEQALHNVVKNAVEAMPGGGVLRIATRAELEQGWLSVVVQDSGPGIPVEERDRIFQSFYTTKSGGTGLGLSIVMGALKNHGGDISIDHPAEGGTRVMIKLPVSGREQKMQGVKRKV